MRIHVESLHVQLDQPVVGNDIISTGKIVLNPNVVITLNLTQPYYDDINLCNITEDITDMITVRIAID